MLNSLQIVKGELTSATKESVLAKLSVVVATTEEFIEKNLYKCERNVYSHALSLIRYLASDFSKNLPQTKVTTKELSESAFRALCLKNAFRH